MSFILSFQKTICSNKFRSSWPQNYARTKTEHPEGTCPVKSKHEHVSGFPWGLVGWKCPLLCARKCLKIKSTICPSNFVWQEVLLDNFRGNNRIDCRETITVKSFMLLCSVDASFFLLSAAFSCCSSKICNDDDKRRKESLWNFNQCSGAFVAQWQMWLYFSS